MKETLNISVNGIRFIINSDAYNVLRTYLDKVEAVYSKEIEGREIISDIEARIAELLLSWQSDSRKVITKECVEDIVQRLGEPDGTPQSEKEPVEQDIKPRFERRLYRSKEGATLGGVLAGLASYFNADVTIFRIMFVLLFVIGCFTGGTLVSILFISYFVMWIIVPKALTARQKMEMKGEPVTASSIENSIKNEINSVYNNPKNEKVASLFSSILYVIAMVMKGFVLFIASIIGVALLIAVICVVAIFIYMLTDIPFVEMCVEMNPYLALTIAAVGLIAPLALLIYSIIRTLFKLKSNKVFISIISILWILSWFASAVLIAKEVSRFRENYSDFKITEVVSTAPSLYIDASDTQAFVKTNILSDKCSVKYYCEQDTLLADSVYRIEVKKRSDGRNVMEARYRALQIEDPMSVVSDSSIVISPNIDFGGDDNVFYNQEVIVNIYYPKNGKVVVSDELRGFSNCHGLFNE